MNTHASGTSLLWCSRLVGALLTAYSLGATALAAQFSLVHKVEDLPPLLADKIEALALIKVYPFKDSKQYIQCTGLHIGGGTILTAGHCFLGSYQCNGAQVQFGLPGPDAPRARCTQVLMNEAAASAYTSSRLDYALFTVDNPPEAAIEIRSNTRDPQLGEELLLAGYPRLSSPKNLDVLGVAQSCSLSSLNGSDFFGRQRAKASVLHNCPAVPGMNGGILFSLIPPNRGDASAGFGLVAMQQAGSITPEIGTSVLSLKSLNNVAQSLARLSPIQNFRNRGEFVMNRSDNDQPTELPHTIAAAAEVRIGSHLAEVFPLGIAEPLNIKVGQFAAAPGSSGRLKISSHVGSGSKLIITDASGHQEVQDGLTFFEATQPRLFQAPVTLRLETGPQSKAFLAHILLEPES